MPFRISSLALAEQIAARKRLAVDKAIAEGAIFIADCFGHSERLPERFDLSGEQRIFWEGEFRITTTWSDHFGGYMESSCIMVRITLKAAVVFCQSFDEVLTYIPGDWEEEFEHHLAKANLKPRYPHRWSEEERARITITAERYERAKWGL